MNFISAQAQLSMPPGGSDAGSEHFPGDQSFVGAIELVSSVEPAVVFKSLAAASVPLLADGCLISVEENDGVSYLIDMPTDSEASGQPVSRSMLTGNGPAVSRGAVRTPIVAPEVLGERSYRGTVLYWWRDRRLPTVIEVGAARLFVQLAVRLITEERLDQQVQEQQRSMENLRLALVSNREIGAAVGILMATEHLSQDEAFGALRTVSQNMHRKLFEVASEVVFTGVLSRPERPSRRDRPFSQPAMTDVVNTQ